MEIPMKNFLVLAAMFAFLGCGGEKKPDAGANATGPGAENPGGLSSGTIVLRTQMEKVSYCIGVNIGKSFKKDGVEVDPDIIVKAMKDALAGQALLLTDEAMMSTMQAFQAEMMRKRQPQMSGKAAEAAKMAAEANKKAGEAFLAENKTKEGVVCLPSGLQYKVITMGDGKKPAVTDTVTCNYRGTLLDGTEFDSSYKRGEPASFPLNGVIKGWTEALQLMPVGSKWQLFIPGNLAYGEGHGPGGPNSTLIFEVEVLGIK
jgi:FKBP-type peptidyl-prolyl cis-trans isomerase FklB